MKKDINQEARKGNSEIEGKAAGDSSEEASVATEFPTRKPRNLIRKAGMQEARFFIRRLTRSLLLARLFGLPVHAARTPRLHSLGPNFHRLVLLSRQSQA